MIEQKLNFIFHQKNKILLLENLFYSLFKRIIFTSEEEKFSKLFFQIITRQDFDKNEIFFILNNVLQKEEINRFNKQIFDFIFIKNCDFKKTHNDLFTFLLIKLVNNFPLYEKRICWICHYISLSQKDLLCHYINDHSSPSFIEDCVFCSFCNKNYSKRRFPYHLRLKHIII